MKITFLFWNVNKKPLQQVIANLVWRHQVTVLILVECEIPTKVMLTALNQQTRAPFMLAQGGICQTVVIYTKLSPFSLTPKFDNKRFTIRALKLPGQKEILLGAVHFISKSDYDEHDQFYESIVLAEEIRTIEAEVGHRRTILVGDLNMNPFESGVVSAKGLHAVMTKEIAAQTSRIVQGQAYPFFYNPMWNLFGDARGGPPGTCYYPQSGHHFAFFWNMFDQVLLRPDLLSHFNVDDLKILSDDGKVSFLRNGVPDNSIASDHLPILFKLELL